MSAELTMCACGHPLHYSDREVQQAVERLITHTGPTVLVRLDHLGRAWRVPRHYIALHGLKAKDLPRLAAELGFEEAPPSA